jgi:4-amino-4-deoxy-L-arabinose transferase-like glycosyltransferase
MKKNREQAPQIQPKNADIRIPLAENNTGLLLSAILIVALIVRAMAFIGYSSSLYGDFLIWDERTYHDWAIHIIQGKSYFVHDFGPLTAYIMAAVYKVFTADPVYVRSLNILFGVLTCLFIYYIGRAIANKTVGLLACLVAALYKPFIFFSILILKESLVLLLFSIVIWCFVSLLQCGSGQPADTDGGDLRDAVWTNGKVLVLGVAIGCLINVRQNAIALIPVFLLLLMWHSYKRTSASQSVVRSVTVYALGLCLSTAPFLVHNFRASGEFKLSPSGGFNLFLGNTLDNPYPYYRPVPFATPVPRDQGVQFVIEASRRTGKRMTPGEASSFWNREVLRIAVENPGKLAWKLWQKTLLLVNRFEAEDNYDLCFISRFVPFFRIPFLAFWFIAPFGIGAIGVTIARSRCSFSLAVIVAVYSATMILFFSNMRIRIPLFVILIPYAALGFQMLFKALKGGLPRRDLRSFLSIVAVVGAIEFLPVAGIGDLSGHYNTHAIVLASKGLRNEAARYWEASSAMEKPYSAYANLSLAAFHYSKQDMEKGNSYLDKIPDASFAAAGKYELIGDGYETQGRIDEAIAAYERSLQINSGQIKPRSKLIPLLSLRVPERVQQAREELAYIRSFYPAGR